MSNIYSYIQARTFTLPVKSARIEHMDAKEVQWKDIQARWGTDDARNLASKVRKDISATKNCMPKGIQSRKGMVDSRNCSISHGGNAG